MARVIIRPGTDIKALKKRLKKRGYVLRAYKQCDGSILYRLHRNSYLPAEQQLESLIKNSRCLEEKKNIENPA